MRQTFLLGRIPSLWHQRMNSSRGLSSPLLMLYQWWALNVFIAFTYSSNYILQPIFCDPLSTNRKCLPKRKRSSGQCSGRSPSLPLKNGRQDCISFLKWPAPCLLNQLFYVRQLIPSSLQPTAMSLPFFSRVLALQERKLSGQIQCSDWPMVIRSGRGSPAWRDFCQGDVLRVISYFLLRQMSEDQHYEIIQGLTSLPMLRLKQGTSWKRRDPGPVATSRQQFLAGVSWTKRLMRGEGQVGLNSLQALVKFLGLNICNQFKYSDLLALSADVYEMDTRRVFVL